VIKVG